MTGVGIIGGGLLGLGIADQLAAARSAGRRLRAAASASAALPAPPTSAAFAVDRYYHAVTTDGRARLALADELGLPVRWRPPRRGLLPRRPPVLDVHPARAAALPRPAARPTSAPRGVRAALPADRGPRGARRRADRGVGAADLRRPPLGAPVAAAARLQVRRPLRRPPGHLPVVAHAPHGRHPRPPRARGDGLDRGRLPGAGRRARAGPDPRARRSRPHRRRRFTRVPCRGAAAPLGVVADGGLRSARPRRHHRSCARTLRAAARPASSSGALGARPVPLPRHRLPRRARAPQREPVLRAQHHGPPRAGSRASWRRPTSWTRSASAATWSTSRATCSPTAAELERSARRDHAEDYLADAADAVPRVPPRGRDRHPGRPRPRTPSRSGVAGAARRGRAVPRRRASRSRSSAHVYPDIVHGQADPRRRRARRRRYRRTCSHPTRAFAQHDDASKGVTQTMTLPTTDRRDRGRRLHRRQPRRAPARRGVRRDRRRRPVDGRPCATSTGCSAAPASASSELDCRDAAAMRREFAGHCDAHRPPRRAEDPALRRRAEDAARSTSTARTPRSSVAPDDRRARRARLDLRRLRQRHAAVRARTTRSSSARRRAAAGPTPRRSTTTSTSPCAWPRRSGLQVTILRFFNAYGPRNHPIVVGRPAVRVPRGPARRPADGAPRRRPPGPLVHVRERHGRRLRARAGHARDVGRGDQHRQRRADRDRRPGPEGPGRDGHRRPAARPASSRSSRSAATTRTSAIRVPDLAKAARLLGFEPAVRLDEGLARTHRVAPARCARQPRWHERGACQRRRTGGRGRSRPRSRPSTARDAALLSAGHDRRPACSRTRSTCSPHGRSARRRYGAVGALWAGMFLIAVLLFRPLEQTVSRAVAAPLARGDGRPAGRPHRRRG